MADRPEAWRKEVVGAILWSYDMGSPIWSNPAVVNGSLYTISKRGRLSKFSLP